MAVIEDEQVKSLVNTDVSDDFGLSVSEVAESCKNYSRFSAWLNSDVTQIKAVLNKVKDNGVSPAFFAAYERSEGYNSSWGWLNHTTQQGSYLEDAGSVARWIVEQSKKTSDNPAWIDFANYKDFVPQSVKDEGNSHFASLPIGTIGRVLIAGTAAATWEVYYPKGLLKEYNGVQDYAKPITAIANSIVEWGGEGGEGVTGDRFIFPTTRNVTSHFRTPERPNHNGTDFSNGVNEPIHATADGFVVDSRVSDSFGEMVIIRHIIKGEIWDSLYGHMVTGSRKVTTGAEVTQGQVIGTMGNTGNSSGIHLHFELHKGGHSYDAVNAVDPMDYLGKGDGTGGSTHKPGYLYTQRRHSTNMRRMGVRGRVR